MNRYIRHLEVAQLLVEAGADKEKAKQDGTPALMESEQMGFRGAQRTRLLRRPGPRRPYFGTNPTAQVWMQCAMIMMPKIVTAHDFLVARYPQVASKRGGATNWSRILALTWVNEVESDVRAGGRGYVRKSEFLLVGRSLYALRKPVAEARLAGWRAWPGVLPPPAAHRLVERSEGRLISCNRCVRCGIRVARASSHGCAHSARMWQWYAGAMNVFFDQGVTMLASRTFS